MNYDNDDCSTAYSPSQNTLQTESGGGISTNLNVKGVPGTGQDQDNSDAGSFWSVTSSEAINLNAREPIHIAEDTKIKMGLGHDYDWEDQVYYPPETMIVVEHDIWTNK
ncbi:hypothetical protein V865_007548 [Kwoniella europaea PYCC6329]|uniref:Uncharacterized protein n=1 Tax=Kwoniella europaea PYCC6329 TaxID=1423913 RepID=A0AAX4KT70_9TREE